jgi:hypothetical protein
VLSAWLWGGSTWREDVGGEGGSERSEQCEAGRRAGTDKEEERERDLVVVVSTEQASGRGVGC